MKETPYFLIKFIKLLQWVWPAIVLIVIILCLIAYWAY